MFNKSGTSIRLLSFRDDQPNELRGSLIPQHAKEAAHQRRTAQKVAVTRAIVLQALVPAFAVLLLIFVGAAGFGFASSSKQAAAPIISIIDPYTQNTIALEYGPHTVLSTQRFFIETRDAFVEEGLTFIEVDLAAMQLRFFKKGILLHSTDILARGESGSWWDTPSGLYKVESKEEYKFSSFAQVYLPWRVTFGGNYVIHGWPEYPDETLVPNSFAGGGVRLSNDDAELLFEEVKTGIPVLVHATAKPTDAFVYQQHVSDIDAGHYLVADLENGTILAANNLKDAVPIASVTKLMSALVATENLDLDSRVLVASPNFVQSLVPRLANRASVSMYSLMQLLLVESSNEAAEVIANQLGRDEFIKLMNTKARQLGMLNSSFADPSGLSSENVSSVEDLYRLTRYIHENRPFIFEITANTNVPTTYVGGEFDSLINFNEIEDMDSFVGGKVGETNAAGQTSVSLHQVKINGEDRIVMIILLGSANRTDDVKALMQYIESNFTR